TSVSIIPLARASSTPLLPFLPPSSSSLVLKEMSIDSLSDRFEAAEATLYLMNIAMLTDPIVYFNWRVLISTTQIALIRSATSQRVFLVPLEHTSMLSWEGFTWLRIVPVKSLRWADVITCG
ncbi:hypothetical protein Gpo141_00011808, partial [Globisporangium polare]